MLLRRRWRSGPSGKSKLRRHIAIVSVVLLLLMIQFYMYIDRSLVPPLVHLATVRMKQVATESINAAISDRIAQNTNFEKLIDWKTDRNGKITGFMLNYAEHMRISADTIQIVQKRLDEIGELPDHIPLGQAMKSPILASFGPEIPIRLVPAAAAKVDLNTRYQNAGINMILVEVYIKVRVEVTVIIPFDSQTEVVETELPVSYSLVVGDVPTYYFDGKGNPLGQTNPMPPGVALPELNMQPGKGMPSKEEAAAEG
ncbi:sporulation protein YunB [Paenibacillus validus]|uniref:sporulation protein YunB n=1 Tax=Paenibacillus TaxID=44249 RepID=UPI000A73BE1B|nr:MULTISPECIES: sporulation protein YunB [Paenibacillus]MED4603884.1 sporulation protein YunB [Paenibacillus validus]MED4609354.1 sporulation protein YunB [Paenibacillus validus]